MRVKSFAYLRWLACSAVFVLGAAWASQAAADDPFVQPSLNLEVEHDPVVGLDVPVTATGTAPPGYSVWVFVDPESTSCPPDPTAQPPGAVTLASAVAVGETFSVSGLYRPGHSGPQSFCAYVWRSSTESSVAVIEVRQVLEPILPAKLARRTVEVALKRHGFAERVVDALDNHCDRRGRTLFACRFRARFQGYRLTGRGRVQRLDGKLTYLFKVRAQGKDFMLTEGNEGQLP